jgi:hypothetical protein
LRISRLKIGWTSGGDRGKVGRVTGISSNKNLLVSCSLLLLFSIIFWSARTDSKALDSEITFDTTLHNSLWNLDVAKMKWVEENHKTEYDTPTMKELSPYLGEWTNHIARLETLGINYKITPFSEMEAQSDVATLTHEIYFHAGFCRYYPAGSIFCLHNGDSFPELDAKSRIRAFYFANRELLAVAVFLLTTVNLLVLAAIKILRKFRKR